MGGAVLPVAVLHDLNALLWATPALRAQDDASVLRAGSTCYTRLSLVPSLPVMITPPSLLPVLPMLPGEDVAQGDGAEA